MNDGELCAFHYLTNRPVRVRWQNGRIVAVLAADKPVSPDEWIAPALVDLQINGYGGVDFQQHNIPLSDLVTASRRLRMAGCGRFLLTLITDEWSKMMERLRHLRMLRERSAELRQAIAGWHIEGPFLSAEPGFCGAHDPALMIDPTAEHIRELREITGSDPVLLTLAPERVNGLPAIELASSLGMKVSLGHTDASAAVISEAIEKGAVGFTHLGNGCPRELSRHDNILWRVFEARGLKVSLIPDTTHVSPPLFRLAHRALGKEAVYYTTDAMSAAGMKPGHYRLGRLRLEVGPDQIVRLPGHSNFAGSALRPIDGVLRAATMLGCSWREVWPGFSEVPAQMMGLPFGLVPGNAANFCVLEIKPDNALRSMKVFVNGAEAK